MISDKFVFDTYAIMEIIDGNENYKEFIDKEIVINDFIFAELCYVLIRKGYPEADKYLDKYVKYIVDVKSEVIKKAMKFRVENKGKKLSMADCISYLMALDLEIGFLTGDKEFEGLDGVEFVR